MVLNFRITHVEHELVAVVICLSVGLFNHPVGMFLIKLALRIDHLRLDPDAEFHSGLPGCADKGRNAARKLVAGRFPVAEPRAVVAARIFVAEPSVVEQKHIDS